MSECQCEGCRPGAAGATYTETHRAACEARHVASMDTHRDRREYLGGVKKARGADAAEALRVAAWRVMRGVG
jgi:hypothetical protein